MTKVEILNMQKKVASKMLSATAMLLISAILMVGVSYAWITISRAPEAKEIKTAISGNGYLEIALQKGSSSGTLARIPNTSGRGDSLLPLKERNTTWGNVVTFDSTYGFNSLILYPSRINVNRLSNSVNTNGYLSVPEYGRDGRITQMINASFLTYTPDDTSPFTEGRTYGVNILGTLGSELSEEETVTYHYRRSMIRDEAAGYLEDYRSRLREEMIDLLESQQVGILNLILQASQLINSSGDLNSETWTDENIETGRAIIRKMVSIVRESEASLKWALLAMAVADDTTYPPDDEDAMSELGRLYKEFQTYPLTADEGVKSIKSIAEANGYNDLADAVDSILRSERQLSQALTYISNNETVTNAFLLIIDVQNTFLKNGSELEPNGPGKGNPATGAIHRIYEVVDPSVKIQGQPARGIYYNYVKKYYNDYLYFVGATPGPTTGLFSIMANLLGDYQATNQAYFRTSNPGFQAENNSGGTLKQWTMYLRVTGKNGTGDNANAIGMNAVSKFNEETNRGVLGNVYDDIMDYDPGNAMISFSVSKSNGSAFGYSIDFAFRTGVDGDLLLAEQPLDRVLGEDEQSAGEDEVDPNVMGGGSNASFTLSGDLMGSNSNAARDLINNIYIVLIDTDTGAILGIVGTDEQEIVLEQATATLAIYEPNITENGILTKGEKRTSNVITSLSAKRPAYITAIVFLNGDTLRAGSVAATQYSSLSGTINLQFESSETLLPVSYPASGG